MTHSASSRIVKAINITIAAGILTVLAVVYWFAWRPLPQRSRTIQSPVQSTTTVSFDARGVPHIQAASVDDALFVQGYVTAQDRLFQMDLLRRFNAGELSEVFGPAALESDRESRRLRLRHIAESGYAILPPADRRALAAYARGVNAFLSTHLDNLPLEFTLARYQPRPWSVIDSLLICLHMFRDLTTTWRDELLKAEMLQAGDATKVQQLFPLRSGAEVQPGSNAWVLSGIHTASGKPLLSNDMHLELSIPGIWYMAHLQAPGLNVSGVALPGLPGIVVGHNQRIAWGITNLHFDVQDLYIEKFDERTGRYLYRGQVEQARVEREIVRVKGQQPVEVLNWVTRFGPIFAGQNTQRMALRWVAAEPGILSYPILDLDQAENWQGFNAVLSRFPGPGSNFVYADVDGNIGYHVAGKLPKRRGYNGDVPIDGSAGDFDWDGFIPYEDLPSAFNPPSGMIVTANQNPFPADYRYPVNGNFASPYRSRQIRDLLGAREKWTAEDMLTVQKDVYSAFHRFLAQQLVAAYDQRNLRNPSLDPAVAMLRSWNGQMEPDLAAPFVTSLAYQHIRSAMAEAAAPDKGQAYTFQMAPAVVENLLRQRPEGWFRSYDEMLLRALVDSLEEARRMQGADLKHWQYGRYQRIRIDHPVIHQVPFLGKYFDIGPVPMPGGITTVKQTRDRLAPSMRMNADLGSWDRSLLNTTIGQSGQILSSHYRDQWSAYYYIHSFPMQFEKIDASSTLTFHP